MKIKFIVHGARWFDKANGNTYHSVRIERCRDGKQIAFPMSYGYDNMYRQTALEGMLKAGWIPKKYAALYNYERENNYPISWSVSDGLKRDCIANSAP